jgi:hypothetical protein
MSPKTNNFCLSAIPPTCLVSDLQHLFSLAVEPRTDFWGCCGLVPVRMDLREICGCVEWIQLAQDRDRWRALVKTVMNRRVLAPRSWLVSQNVKHGLRHLGSELNP